MLGDCKQWISGHPRWVIYQAIVIVLVEKPDMDYETIATIGFAALFGMAGVAVFPIWQLGLAIGIVTGAALGIVLTKQSQRVRELEHRVETLEATDE